MLLLGMKLILDFIPNHTGKKHEWFNKSREGDEYYKDFYIWADGKGPNKSQPPNDWVRHCILQKLKIVGHFK